MGLTVPRVGALLLCAGAGGVSEAERASSLPKTLEFPVWRDSNSSLVLLVLRWIPLKRSIFASNSALLSRSF